MELPHKTSSDLHLVVATPKELLQQQHNNSGEWKGALSLEAYLRREKSLLQLDLTKDGGLTPWLLVYQPQNQSRQVLCGCESIKKKALIARNGRVEEAVAHGVASVFTPIKYRGRGYAGRMMEEVARKLKTWQVDEGKISEFSILFSDIGKDFYAARGWQPFPSSHVTLPAKATNPPKSIRKLDTGDLPELCQKDEQLLRKRLRMRSNSERSAVALVPDFRTLQWHNTREDFQAKELHGNNARVMEGGRGASIDMEDGCTVSCYWTRVWTNPQEEAPNTLHILRLIVEGEREFDFLPATDELAASLQGEPTVKAISALFAAAQDAAEAAGMDEVQIWNPTSITLAALRTLDEKAAIVAREKESITSLQWYGEGSWRDIDWICNEKYGWC